MTPHRQDRQQGCRPVRHLFVGGPGRSGTSFVADRLGTHPDVAAFKDIELKIFCEKNGLLDLHHALVETYSPNRAVQALDQFRRMTEALVAGRYGQPALSTAAPAGDWHAAFAAFAEALLEDGHPGPRTDAAFMEAARGLLAGIATLAARAAGRGDRTDDAADGDSAGPGITFLEKTPHSLLAIGFLARLAPDARFLHVMRDPRSIAWSLLAMRWGPDTLPAAARWVESYCRAWSVAEAEAARLGLPLACLHIEEAAAAPEAAAAWLTSRLGLAPCPGLLRGADAAVLNRWVAKAAAEDRAELDRRLGGWVAHFGYDAARIGHRPSPDLPGTPAGPARAERSESAAG